MLLVGKHVLFVYIFLKIKRFKQKLQLPTVEKRARISTFLCYICIVVGYINGSFSVIIIIFFKLLRRGLLNYKSNFFALIFVRQINVSFLKFSSSEYRPNVYLDLVSCISEGTY